MIKFDLICGGNLKQAEAKNSFFKNFKSGMSATVVFTALLVGCILDSSVNQAPPDPRIFLQTPNSITVLIGSKTYMAVRAAGHDTISPFQYKWVKNGIDTLPDSNYAWEHNGADSSLVSSPSTIFGGFVQGFGYTTDTLVISSDTIATFSYKCVLRNSRGIAVSEPTTIRFIDLPPDTRTLYERGEIRYQICVSCHGLEGRGNEVTPPFNPSDYVMADSRRFIRLQLLGLPNFIDTTANIIVNGRSFGSSMEGPGGNDSDIASVLTYIRDRFNGATDFVAPETVAEIRDSMVTLCAQHMSQNPSTSHPCLVNASH